MYNKLPVQQVVFLRFNSDFIHGFACEPTRCSKHLNWSRTDPFKTYQTCNVPVLVNKDTLLGWRSISVKTKRPRRRSGLRNDGKTHRLKIEMMSNNGLHPVSLSVNMREELISLARVCQSVEDVYFPVLAVEYVISPRKRWRVIASRVSVSTER